MLAKNTIKQIQQLDRESVKILLADNLYLDEKIP
jgi:hypothetical protein